ncbi:hypothetical protein AB6F95_004628 [Salmonella enterica]
MPIFEYIKLHFDGNQSAFGRAVGVAPAQVTQWIKGGFIVLDGAIWSKRRDLPEKSAA